MSDKLQLVKIEPGDGTRCGYCRFPAAVELCIRASKSGSVWNVKEFCVDHWDDFKAEMREIVASPGEKALIEWLGAPFRCGNCQLIREDGSCHESCEFWKLRMAVNHE